MEGLGVGIGALDFRPIPSRLLGVAKCLIGCNDAELWYRRYYMLYKHPRFTEEQVPLVDTNGDSDQFQKIWQRLHLDDNTIWAHPHPDWQRSFGVYIVRRGRQILYQGRSEFEVEQLLLPVSAL